MFQKQPKGCFKLVVLRGFLDLHVIWSDFFCLAIFWVVTTPVDHGKKVYLPQNPHMKKPTNQPQASKHAKLPKCRIHSRNFWKIPDNENQPRKPWKHDFLRARLLVWCWWENWWFFESFKTWEKTQGKTGNSTTKNSSILRNFVDPQRRLTRSLRFLGPQRTKQKKKHSNPCKSSKNPAKQN